MDTRKIVKNILREMHDDTQGFRHNSQYDAFKADATRHIEALSKLIEDNLPYQGDTCETSQRICILNSLKQLEATVEGLIDDDFIDHHGMEQF